MIHALRLVALALLALVVPAIAQAPIDIRIALVIGNSAYPNSPLANPANDARSMGEALRKLGFQVETVLDADKARLKQSVNELAVKLKGRNGMAVLYYAGHGLQINYDNYLIPVDAKIRQESDIASQSINANELLASLITSSRRLSVMILDACRDNPFKDKKSFAGLSPRDAPIGALIAYATEPGNVAQDGDAESKNGLYTQYLLKELSRPETSINEIFKRVRFAVRRASQGQQIPSYTNGLDSNYNFANGLEEVKLNLQARADRFAIEKAHWDQIKTSKNSADHYDFIDLYPDSGISELAQAVLERLERRKLTAQVQEGEAAQNPADSRFRIGDSYSMRLSTSNLRTSRDITVRVTEVNNEIARYTDVFGTGQIGESTIAGAVIKDGISTYDPPYVLVPGGEYQVGKRWSGRSIRTYNTGKKEWMDYSGRVVSREKVTVPAGIFESYKVEFQFQLESGTLQKSTIWVQPEWGIGLKTQFQFLDAQGVLQSGLREMVNRQR